MSYAEFANNPVSEKIVLAWFEPAERFLLWELHSGAVYKRSSERFVIDIQSEGASLTEGSSASLSAGEWWYDASGGYVYVRMGDDSNPQESYMVGFYRLFFSNKALNLSFDLDGGTTVPYEPYLKTVSSFKEELDNSDMIGIAVENNGRISFFNNDNFFDAIFDKLFWESKNVTLFSWNPEIDDSEARKLFQGEVTEKAFGSETVSFQVKDQLYKLRNEVGLGSYSSSDGVLSADIIGQAKRRIYGRVKGCQIQSLDMVADGYSGTGTIAHPVNSIQKIVLDGSYTNCVASDVGKQVKDDGLEVGALLAFDNSINTWWINSTSTILDNSVMTITSGTGAGDCSGDSEVSEVGLIGTGTSFLSELSPDDNITFDQGGLDEEITVSNIISDVFLELSDDIEASFTGKAFTISPEVQHANKNREFLVAGHKLREPTTTVSFVPIDDFDRFQVLDVSDFFPDDNIKIGSQSGVIKRISGQWIILRQVLPTLPTVSETVSKEPVNVGYFNKRSLVIDRDWTIDNQTDSCKITLEDDAEFNSTPIKTLSGAVTFTNSSRRVTVSGANFQTEVETRHWIRSKDNTHTTWYEVLQVIDESTLDLRVAYAGPNWAAGAQKKNVKYIADDSIVTVDCMGMEYSGLWVKTASDVVKHLLIDAGIDNINTASFTEAAKDSEAVISLALPLDFGSDAPIVREIITIVNKSVFGSLYNNINFELSYNILSPEIPETIAKIDDADILNFSAMTKSDICRKTIGRYQHFDADRYTGEQGAGVVEYSSDFNKYLTGSNKDVTIDFYLYNENEAQNMAERHNFYKSLSQAVVTVNGKLNLSLFSVNDLISLDFNRLYQRFGGTGSNGKVGIISGITRSGSDIKLTVSDLGNLFNRAGVICINTANEYSVAEEEERLLNAYIVDDDLDVPDTANESLWGCNLIC